MIRGATAGAAGTLDQDDDSDVIAFMRRFRSHALWAVAAAVAVVAAIFSSQSEDGAQRITAAPAPITGSEKSGKATPQFDAEAAVRPLIQAVMDLRKDRERLTTRVDAVEHDIDDITGSISKQIEAAKTTIAQYSTPWPMGEPSTTETSAALVAMLSPSPAVVAMALSSDPLAPPAAWPLVNRASAGPPTAYGANRTELRLVVGPFESADAAARLCIELSAFKQPCQPTMFGGQLALQ